MKVATSKPRRRSPRRAGAVALCLAFGLMFATASRAGEPGDSARGAASQDAPLSLRDLQLLQSLEKRKEELDRRETAMKAEEERLQGLREQIEKRQAAVGATEKRVLQIMGMADKVGEEKLERLAKLYSSMRPEDAGPLLDRIDDDIALKIFLRMKPRQASRILPYMKPEKAAALSDRMAQSPGAGR